MITEDLITEVDGIPVFNPEAKLIKEFKTLIERDKGSEGDSQGRKKLQSTKELAFVALYVNLKSAYNRNYEPASRVAELKRGLKLPDDWVVDDAIKAAMKEYAKTQVTPSSAMLVSVRNGLYEARNIVTILEKKLKKTMELLQEADLLGGFDEAEEAKLDVLMEKAVKYVELLLKYGKQITDQLATLKTLENQYVKEIEEAKGKNKQTVNKHQL